MKNSKQNGELSTIDHDSRGASLNYNAKTVRKTGWLFEIKSFKLFLQLQLRHFSVITA